MGWSSRGRLTWLTILFVCLGGSLFIQPARLYLVPAVAVISAGIAIWGIRAWRPPAARAWWTVAAGVALLASGYVISGIDASNWPDLRRPYPQPYDLIFVLGSAVVIIGAVLLLGRIHPSRHRGDLLDALMVAVGIGSVVVQRMFGVQLAMGDHIGVPPIIAVMFPLASVVLLTAVVRALLTGGVRNSTMLLLTAAVLAAVLSDIPRARQAADGVLPYDSVLAAISVVKMALFAAAVASPAVADPRMYAPARPTLRSRTRLLVVAGLAFLGPLSLAVAWLAGRPVDPRLPLVASSIILVLAVVRVDGLLRRIEHRATHDPLTGVLDRATFHQAAVSRAQGSAGWFVGILDVDDFKRLNDTYGHLAGDQVLVESAQRIASTLSDHDVVGRLGGDEFGVIFRADRPEMVASALVQALRGPLVVEEQELAIGVSLGICHLLIDDSDPEGAVSLSLRRADRAMYRVKGTEESFAVDRS